MKEETPDMLHMALRCASEIDWAKTLKQVLAPITEGRNINKEFLTFMEDTIIAKEVG